MEDRKIIEAEFHNRVRNISDSAFIAHDSHAANKRFYKVTRSSEDYIRQWMEANCKGKKVLDYCCGNGENSIRIAESGARLCVGIDISDVSISNAKKTASDKGLSERTRFLVADAEDTKFPDAEFDVIICAGVLHHLEVIRAFPELARILKDDGKVLAIEALNINPVFQLYRRLTPALRTEWETNHILGVRELSLAQNYFMAIDTRYFHLAVLLAAFVHRHARMFKVIYSAGEILDKVLMRIPFINRLAWQMVFELSRPIR